MGLQKFWKNILKATHNLEFSAVSVFPDSSITLDIRVSVPTILVLNQMQNFSLSRNVNLLVSQLGYCIFIWDFCLCVYHVTQLTLILSMMTVICSCCIRHISSNFCFFSWSDLRIFTYVTVARRIPPLLCFISLASSW